MQQKKITDKPTLTNKKIMEDILMDYDENQKAPIPRLIWKDHHTSWDRCHYDFGHYGGKNKEGHHNYKASYYMKK